MPSSRNGAQLNSKSSTFNHRRLDFRIASNKMVCYRIDNVLRQVLSKEWSAGIFILLEAAFSLEARWWTKKIKEVQTDPRHSFSLRNSPSVEVTRDPWLTSRLGCLSMAETHSFTEKFDFTFRKKYSLRINFSLWVSPTCSNIWLLGLEIVRNSPSLIWAGFFLN